MLKLMQSRNIYLSLCVLFIALFAAEYHSISSNDEIYRPSIHLIKYIKKIGIIARYMGHNLAAISSFIPDIDLTICKDTINNLLDVVLKCITVCFDFIDGYFKKAQTRKDQELVIIGTLILLVLISKIIKKITGRTLYNYIFGNVSYFKACGFILLAIGKFVGLMFILIFVHGALND